MTDQTKERELTTAQRLEADICALAGDLHKTGAMVEAVYHRWLAYVARDPKDANMAGWRNLLECLMGVYCKGS